MPNNIRSISSSENLLYVDKSHAKRLVRKAVLVGSISILLVGTMGLIAAFYGNDNPADTSGTGSGFWELPILILFSTISCAALTAAAANQLLGIFYRNRFIQVFDQAIIVNYRTFKIIPFAGEDSIHLSRDDAKKIWRIRPVAPGIKSIELPVAAFPELDKFLRKNFSSIREYKNNGDTTAL